MIKLPDKWSMKLTNEPETGMGYQVVSVVLTDGRRFDQAIVVDGQIVEIRGHTHMPFDESQISEVILTHDKWDFGSTR